MLPPIIGIMHPDRWQKVKELFQAAIDRETGERSDFLSEACGNDEPLRREVESLIDSYKRDGSFIDSPAYVAAAETLLSDHVLKAGQIISHYQILSPLRRGGMGEVYLARDTKLDRKVALKILPADVASNRNRMHRFVLEAKAASALNHPNILTIYEIGEADGQRFIVTEFIEGMTLRDRLHSSLDIEEAVDIGIQISSALAAAHNVHIVHRDIKPENIMIRNDDGLVKVL